jgi:hypothetical protein
MRDSQELTLRLFRAIIRAKMRTRLRKKYNLKPSTTTQKESFRPYILSIISIIALTYVTFGVQSISVEQSNAQNKTSRIDQHNDKSCAALGRAIDTNGLLQCVISEKPVPQNLKLGYASF